MSSHHSEMADHSPAHAVCFDDCDFLPHISHSRFTLVQWPEFALIGQKLLAIFLGGGALYRIHPIRVFMLASCHTVAV